MARNMSFFHTTEQIRGRTKTVTRRTGWQFLQPGDLVWACVKCQGLRAGEKVEKLALLRVKSNTSEPVEAILGRPEECAAEGFPDRTPEEFVEFFCRAMQVCPNTVIQRIEFEYVDAPLQGELALG